MGRYVVAHDYASNQAGPYRAGDEVELDDDLAAFLARDSPGVLRALAPSADRMVRTTPTRGRARAADDREGSAADSGPMSRGDHGAVKG